MRGVIFCHARNSRFLRSFRALSPTDEPPSAERAPMCRERSGACIVLSQCRVTPVVRNLVSGDLWLLLARGRRAWCEWISLHDAS